MISIAFMKHPLSLLIVLLSLSWTSTALANQPPTDQPTSQPDITKPDITTTDTSSSTSSNHDRRTEQLEQLADHINQSTHSSRPAASLGEILHLPEGMVVRPTKRGVAVGAAL